MRHIAHGAHVLTETLTSYAATRGFLWAHMGWIFFKPQYERLELIDRTDLDNDPGKSPLPLPANASPEHTPTVVRLQHKYYGECGEQSSNRH